jgi:ABC-type phosphate/phosphonate transport system substrate-binding protein
MGATIIPPRNGPQRVPHSAGVATGGEGELVVKVRTRISLSAAALLLAASARIAAAAELKIVIMQSQAGDARKYQPLLAYLARNGLPASFVTAPDPRTAVDMFAGGTVDAMFGGSGIAGTMLIKRVAEPLVRPVAADGSSSYAAVVVAAKGSPRFDGSGKYFDGKRVIFASLASAGEFYFRSTGASRPAATLRAASHGAALDALARGQADVAVVKNHVWSKEQAKYPAFEAVGGDSGENPDGTLVVSKKVDAATAQRITAILLGIEADPSPDAALARESLKIKRFIPATEKDFAHTVAMLKSAGVTKDFAFRF